MTTMISKFAGRCVTCGGWFEAGTRIMWARGRGASHLSSTECEAARAAKAARIAAATGTPDAVNMRPIAEFLLRAKFRGTAAAASRGRTSKGFFPKARFLAPGAGTHEIRLSVAGDKATVPGAIQVKLDDEWIGRVNPDGTVYGSALLNRLDIQAELNAIAADPAGKARAYGKLMGCCAFCERRLTDDRTGASVEMGYGPHCAERYGLPFNPRGSAAVLSPVPVVDPIVAAIASESGVRLNALVADVARHIDFDDETAPSFIEGRA